jgi:hypothetical protein
MQLARRLMQRPRKNVAPDLWQFGLDVRDVMLERTARAMKGQLSAAEARRMVLEKQAAAVRAQLVCAQALLEGDPGSASRDVFETYRGVVQSNRKRLRSRRWPWKSL